MSHEVSIRKIRPQPYVAIRAITTPEKLDLVVPDLHGQVIAYVDQQGGRTDGPGFVRYYDYEPDRVEIEVGFPLRKAIEVGDHFTSGELPGGKAAWTLHRGPWDSLQDAHDDVGEYVLATGRDPKGAPWELLIVGPPHESDPARWETEVVWPLR